MCEFVDDRDEHVGWGEVVHGLGEGDEDLGDAELVVSEVPVARKTESDSDDIVM